MIFLFLILFFMSGVLFFFLKKDIFHPSVISNFVFAAVVFGYILSSHIYVYSLHANTLIFIFSSVATFSVAAYLFDSLTQLIQFKRKKNGCYFSIEKSNKKLAFVVLCLSFLYLILRLKGYSFGSSIIAYLNQIRAADVEDTARNPVSYLQPFMLASFAMYVLSNSISVNRLNKLANILIIAIFSFSILLNTGKQIVFMVIMSYFYIVGVKKTKHFVYLLLSVAGLFAVYMVLLRGLNGSVIYYLSMYLVSPLIAFQHFYFENNTSYAISHALWFFERIWALFSGGIPESLHKEFVWVGLPTNVYTAFSDYYTVSPFLNFFMMIVHGAISGILWNISRYNNVVKVFYSYFIYTFAFIFYHESFMVNLSSWMQMIIAIFILNFLVKERVYK